MELVMSTSKLAAVIALCGSLTLVATQTVAQTAAARLTSVDGPVMVNQGAGFTPLTDKTVLKAGDRVLSLKGAHARLVYANGCAVPLKGAALLTVNPGAGCAKSQVVSADTDKTGDAILLALGPLFFVGVAGVAAVAAAAASGAFSTSG
jgi:hypothetical protein